MKQNDPAYEKKEALKTIIALAVACLALYLLFHWRWCIGAALLLLFTGMIGGKLPLLIAEGWKKLAMMLGTANTSVLLFIVYYLVLTPLAFISRCGDRKVSAYFRRPEGSSLFVDAEKKYGKDTFEKLW